MAGSAAVPADVAAALAFALKKLHAVEVRPQGLLLRAFSPTVSAVAARPDWAVVGLPLAVASAFGADEKVAVALAGAALLFFAGADVVDDAQDGHLEAVWTQNGESWREAVAAGLALTFLAQRSALEAVAGDWGCAVAREFAAAGLQMSLGQYVDLKQRGEPRAAVTEATYLACIAEKSGAAFSLFAVVGACVVEVPSITLAGLAAYGRALGMAFQLASDIEDICAESGRDRPNRQLTLPIIKAWDRLEAGDRELLLASWRGEPDAAPLPFLLERSGALLVCQVRLAALRVEAAQALEGLALPKGLFARLSGYIEQARARAPGNF
jgi:geranylgeranyl diphosphate synthase type I